MDFFRMSEFKKKKATLSDVIEWSFFIDAGIIFNKDGSFQRTYVYRGRDLNACTEEELVINSSQLNNIFKRLGDGWVLYSEAARIRCAPYPQRDFADPLTATIDKEREIDFNEGEYFETNYYLTLQYKPQSKKWDKLFSTFFISQEQAKKSLKEELLEELKDFKSELNNVMNLFCSVVDYCRPLSDDETVTYLHSCISLRRHAVKMPEARMMLDHILADTPLVGGFKPMLGHPADSGSEHLSVVSILYLSAGLVPCVLDSLNSLGFEYRWVSRFLFTSKNSATSLLESYRTGFTRKEKSMRTLLTEYFSKQPSNNYNPDAIAGLRETQEALAALGGDECGFGYLTVSVVIRDKDRQTLDKKEEVVRKVIEGFGFNTIIETRNAVDAWLGSLPGHAKWQPRYLIASSLYLAYMFPLSSVWAGYKFNKAMKTPPLLLAQTDSTTPFRFNLHIGDVGHTMIVGPTGAGKSVLLNFIAAQTRGVPGSQVFIFDQGGSSRCMTAGVHGTFYDIGKESEDALSFQPLGCLEDEEDLNTANLWLEATYANEHIVLTPEEKTAVWDALLSMRAYPKHQRKISLFQLLVPSQRLKDGINPYTVAGPYGRILDADSDSMADGSWQVFETEILLRDMKNAVEPILFYLFHQIEKRCCGPWTYIIFDESWAYLKNAYFISWLEEFLRKARKKHVSVIFATQDLSEIGKSDISNLVVSSCMSKIYLPNAEVMTPQIHEIYSKLGLNDREIGLIADAVPKRDYYYKSVLGSRKFSLALSPFALSYVGASSPEEQSAAKQILQEHPDEDFNTYWITAHGFGAALEYYNSIKISAAK